MDVLFWQGWKTKLLQAQVAADCTVLQEKNQQAARRVHLLGQLQGYT